MAYLESTPDSTPDKVTFLITDLSAISQYIIKICNKGDCASLTFYNNSKTSTAIIKLLEILEKKDVVTTTTKPIQFVERVSTKLGTGELTLEYVQEENKIVLTINQKKDWSNKDLEFVRNVSIEFKLQNDQIEINDYAIRVSEKVFNCLLWVYWATLNNQNQKK